METDGEEVSKEAPSGSEAKPHICMQCQKPKTFKRKGDFDNHIKVLHGSVERLDRTNKEELLGLLQKSLEQSHNNYRLLERLSKEVQALHRVVDKLRWDSQVSQQFGDSFIDSTPRSSFSHSYNHDAKFDQTIFPSYGTQDMPRLWSHSSIIGLNTPYQLPPVPHPGLHQPQRTPCAPNTRSFPQQQASFESIIPAGEQHLIVNNSVSNMPYNIEQSFNTTPFMYPDSNVSGTHDDFLQTDFSM